MAVLSEDNEVNLQLVIHAAESINELDSADTAAVLLWLRSCPCALLCEFSYCAFHIVLLMCLLLGGGGADLEMAEGG